MYEHNDGLKSTMLLMSGLVRDFNFAARLDNGILSTQMYLPMPDGRTTLANFFSPLVNNMEQMFLTGKPTYPGGADAAHDRTDRGRRREPVCRADRNSRRRTWRSAIRRLASRRSGEAE